MKHAVVDASVAVKWVVDETHREAAMRWFATRRLTAPALLHAEVASALSKKVTLGELDADEAARKMREIVSAGVETVPDELLAVEAVRLSASLGHPVYDCFYLALAIAESAPVITADRALLDAARAGGLDECVVWIEDVA